MITFKTTFRKPPTWQEFLNVITAKELEALGITRQALNNWLNGSMPSAKYIAILQKYYGVRF